MKKKDLIQCVECESLFYLGTSQMNELCPQCAQDLYGYENCEHVFVDGRCKKCYWDGSTSSFTENQ
ncbi:hypothetical protein R9C00_01885 [Flammeovirgaceae bacterium SG7u.111]|nr:hypothetical protein [Flammeovirgaceae bacterium SG7u.132]WPO36192.1 hypothetical protein R9C00_01885 [Flammeovirgaceae bacterium SG7u.111]